MWTLIAFVCTFLGFVNDCKFIKNVAYDSIILSSTLVLIINQLEHQQTSLELSEIVFCLGLGLSWASFERFCLGMIFHWNEKINAWHQLYHDQLVERALTKRYIPSDHMIEAGSYLCLFGLYYFVGISCVSQSFVMWFLFGVLSEHYIGFKIRLHLQYNDINIEKMTKSWLGTVYVNMYVYYWYHVIVNGETCMGFSSPFWDLLFDRYPFQAKPFSSTPLPFLDFFTLSYSDQELSQIVKGIQEGKAAKLTKTQ